MDLFVVNRYKDSEEEPSDNDKEYKILQKLKAKIALRKKANIVTKQEFAEVSLKCPKTNIVSTVTKSELETSTPVESILKNEHEPIDSNRTEAEKQITEFKILGDNQFEKKIKVKRVLPHWLSNPFSISMNLKELSCHVTDVDWLHPTLKETLRNEGIVSFFPVQESVIPFILYEHKSPSPLWPRDICVSAPTGSGKTLAFVLPIIQILMKEVDRHIRALIVLPVQELATQVAKVFRIHCAKTGLKVALLSPTSPLHQEQQQLVRYTESSSWVSEVDIVVSTAGRLVEHIKNTEGFCLKYLKFLVIDEADRIMDHIQNDWLYHLERHMKFGKELMTEKMSNLSWNNLCLQNQPPHKLLFSATLSQDPEKLEHWGLFQPKLFSVVPKNCYEDDERIKKYTTPQELKEFYIISEAEEKPLILYYLLAEKKWNRVLCFTNSTQTTHRLAVLMKNMGEGMLQVAELSSSLDSLTRESVLKQFDQSQINLLIGTDALARGIDLSNCDYVLSYDPPKNIKTYIHRIGRTGRAGRDGCAITMLLPHQLSTFKGTLTSGGKNDILEFKIEDNLHENYASKYETAIQETKNHIVREVNSKVTKSISLKRGTRTKLHKKSGKKLNSVKKRIE